MGGIINQGSILVSDILWFPYYLKYMEPIDFRFPFKCYMVCLVVDKTGGFYFEKVDDLDLLEKLSVNVLTPRSI